jgi:hypothetical protein
MTSAAKQASDYSPRWVKWLGAFAMAVFLVALGVDMHEEVQIFAAATGVPTPTRSAAIILKNKVYYVTDDQRRIHQLSQDVAFAALTASFGLLMWVRRKRRRTQAPAGM